MVENGYWMYCSKMILLTWLIWGYIHFLSKRFVTVLLKPIWNTGEQEVQVNKMLNQIMTGLCDAECKFAWHFSDIIMAIHCGYSHLFHHSSSHQRLHHHLSVHSKSNPSSSVHSFHGVSVWGWQWSYCWSSHVWRDTTLSLFAATFYVSIWCYFCWYRM